MKSFALMITSLVSISSFAASDVILFANINVTETSAVSSTDSRGNVDINTYTSEETFVIGTSSSNGRQSQIVARVEGCKFLVSPKTVKLLVSNQPNRYAGMFQKTTYTMTVNSSNECKEIQRLMRSATALNPVKLQINGETFTTVNN